MVIAGLLIASPAVAARILACSAPARSSPISHASGRGVPARPAGTPRSLMRRSPSLTTPSTRPASSVTGTPLMRRSSRRRATSLSGVSGRTETTSAVITS